jgi:hypothetical protein
VHCRNEGHSDVRQLTGDADEVVHVVGDAIPHASRQEAFDETDDGRRCMCTAIGPRRISSRHGRADAYGEPGDDGHDVPHDGGQMDPSGMMSMMGSGEIDPKAMARMLELRGDLLKAMGEVMLKHAKAMEAGR